MIYSCKEVHQLSFAISHVTPSIPCTLTITRSPFASRGRFKFQFSLVAGVWLTLSSSSRRIELVISSAWTCRETGHCNHTIEGRNNTVGGFWLLRSDFRILVFFFRKEVRSCLHSFGSIKKS